MKRKPRLWSAQLAAARPSLLLLGLLALVLGAAIVGQSALIAAIVDQAFLERAQPAALLAPLGTLLAVIAVRVLCLYGSGRIGLTLAARAKTAIRQAAIRKLARDPMAASLRGETGAKVSVVMDAVDEGDSYYSQYIPRMLETAFVPPLLLIVVFAVHWPSGLIMLLTAPFIPIFMILVGLRTKRKSEEKFEELAAFSGAFLGALQGLTTLKLYGKAERQEQEIERSSNGFREATMSILRIAFTNTLMMELVVMLSIGVVALELAFRMLIQQSVSFEAAFFILLLAPEFYSAIKNLGTAFHSGRTSLGALKKVEELLEADGRGAVESVASSRRDAAMAPRPDDTAQGANRGAAVEPVQDSAELGTAANAVSAVAAPSAADKLTVPQGANRGADAVAKPSASRKLTLPQDAPPTLELYEARYAYGPGAFALDVGTVRIAPGEHVAIVGPSGAGKTTLLHLFAGLLPPDRGELRIDGHPLVAYEADAWYRRISYITQHPYVFTGTIADNIAIGARGEASRAAIRRAAEAAGLGTLVDELPQGLDTAVGESGRGLSGGERQRLALARAFVNRPGVLLFDEPTASLDLHTEQVLQRAIAELSARATMITVAHRLHTIRAADRILYLEEGRLAGSGRHEELLRTLPSYAEMVRLQAGGDGA
ncbi:ABC transporter ATP-binding protein/permease [Paenibacillus sp. IB182496]|uniref:ABC transporter ATP-binding protein/permease n=1 Tax=Paenibacillus sabuli TaxID=2772509 RepID=A0A927BSC4_9BACL|nr:ABC transporter ATP-binding protein/permease [Paenibacillus sabuli]MBD2845407.1 ABC transporter ATP-binding protein/permease [Paenibacillus sabuli]